MPRAEIMAGTEARAPARSLRASLAAALVGFGLIVNVLWIGVLAWLPLSFLLT